MNKTEILDALVEKLKVRSDAYAYFFETADSSEWIPALRAKGFFVDPMPTEHLEGGLVRFPFWPESRYLARVAGQAQNDVLDIILSCRSSDNPRVHEDFIQAGLQMTGERSERLVPLAIEWLDDPYLLLLPRKVGALVQHLAQQGRIEGALRLARRLLRLSVVQAPGQGDQVDDPFRSPPEPVAAYDAWDYKSILEEYVPPLVQAAGLRAVSLLCDELDQALQVSHEPPHDASFVWRPSVGEHEQNMERMPRDFLVSAIRDAVSSLIEARTSSLADAVELLMHRRWDIFARLALETARRFSSVDPDVGLNLMMRRDLFEGIEVSHEYDLLLPVAFRQAPDDERLRLLGWIDAGPDMTTYVDRIRAERGTEPSTEELNEIGDLWRWRRLAHLPTEDLPNEWRERKASLADRLDPPPDFPFSVQTWYGSVSPIPQSELAAMSTAHMVAFIRGVKYSGSRLDSTADGLANTLEAVAADDPTKISGEILEFRGLEPLYVRSIYQGLRQAVSTAKSVAWDRILIMAEWVLDQPRELEGGSGGTYGDIDPGWVWTRKAMADLLEQGLGKTVVPLALRDSIWRVILALLEDPESEDDYDEHPDRPAERSLNSIRGMAMHCLVLYAYWVSQASNGTWDEPRSLAIAPEARDELDRRLDPTIDTAATVRAVYGMRFGLLAHIDPEWASSNAARVFSAEGHAFDRLGQVAWDSYLLFGGSYLNVMDILRAEYLIAVQSFTDAATGHAGDPQSRLADHLMTLYWHGHLGDEPDTDVLLRDFVAGAPVQVRGEAIAFLGRSLREAGELGGGVVERLMLYWDSRVGSVSALTGDAGKAALKELEFFGWWLFGEALEWTWRISRLEQVLRLGVKVEPDQVVVGALAGVPQ